MTMFQKFSVSSVAATPNGSISVVYVTNPIVRIAAVTAWRALR